MPLARFLSSPVISIASDEHPGGRVHSEEAKKCPPCGHRITRNCSADVSFLLRCSPTWSSLISGWSVIGETPRGQPWTPALTLPHVRDERSVRLMEVFCTFPMLAMCRHGHRELMRDALPDWATLVPTTPCHQSNDVETYRRCRKKCPRTIGPLASVAWRSTPCVASRVQAAPRLLPASHSEREGSLGLLKREACLKVRAHHTAACCGDKERHDETMDARPPRGTVQRDAGGCLAAAPNPRDPATWDLPQIVDFDNNSILGDHIGPEA